ncbi:MAG: hypothetical protein Udaeo2_15050 [Candidatus Udaeobacter sp.]|nr:MAG: hypothetical protein Udaeo2_15050 [Candidatus Udaeobacter sp.]
MSCRDAARYFAELEQQQGLISDETSRATERSISSKFSRRFRLADLRRSRFNPCWDSLRGDKRFDKIVAAAKAASR